MRGAARHADDRQPRLGLPVPAQVVGHAHGAGRVARHRVDPAVGGAGADGQDRGGLRRQPVEPLAGGHRLARRRVVAEAAPVALGLDRLVRYGPLDDEDERVELAAIGLVPPLDERVRALLGTALEVDQGPVHRHLRESGQGPQHDLLDARLGRGGQRHRVPVASEPPVHPENMDDWLLLRHRMPPFGWLPARAGWRSGGELDRASRHLWVRRVRSRGAQQIVGGGRRLAVLISCSENRIRSYTLTQPVRSSYSRDRPTTRQKSRLGRQTCPPVGPVRVSPACPPVRGFVCRAHSHILS